MVNFALIGYGYWGKNHLATLADIDEAKVVYVCDTRGSAHKLPQGSAFHTSTEAVFDDPRVDAIILATPTATHYTLAKRALEKGKHVLVEKPLTTSVKEGLDLVETAERCGKILMVGDLFRFSPAVTHIIDMVKRGEIGDLRYMEARRVGLGPIRNDVSVLWDLATHDIYMFNLIAGSMPLTASYQGTSHNGKLDDVANLALKFPGNVLGTIAVNWEHPVKERRMVIGGSKSAIEFKDTEPADKITIYERGVDYQPSSGDIASFQAAIRSGNTMIPRINLGASPLERELRHFISCIMGKEKNISDGSKGLETIRVLEAAELSRLNKGVEVAVQSQTGFIRA